MLIIQKTNDFINSKKGMFLTCLIIIILNVSCYLISRSHHFSNEQARLDASGFVTEKGEKFIYFYYYTNYFPLATLNKNLEYSKEGALKEIKQNSNKLIMEYGHWSRLGENARIWCFLPNAILQQSTKNPHIKLFNGIIFTIALIIFFIGAYKIKKGLSALIIILIVQFTPFFLYEVYTNPNIFALLASGYLIVLGLQLPYLEQHKLNYIGLLISGIIIALFTEIRNENLVVLGTLIILVIFIKNSVKYKLIAFILLLFSFIFTQLSIRKYFDYKFDQTTQLLQKNGGNIYTGGRIKGHKFWHPIFCGLGDFDKELNYPTKDTVAYRYAVPILNEKYNLNIRYSGKYHTDNYYDKDSLYYMKFDEIPEYENILKDKVLLDIRSNPWWFTKIILKRIHRILSHTIPFKNLGYISLILILTLIYFNKTIQVNIILSSLPLSISPLLFFSGGNATYNSFFPFITIWIIIQLIFDVWFTNKPHFN
jgi:hypothetical protein